MKKYIIYIFLVAISFSSCDLDLASPSEIVQEEFWVTENDAWYAVNACYAGLPSFSAGMIDEMTTDNAHSHKPWEGPMELIQQGSITPGDGFGGYSYVQIRRASNVVENIDKCDISNEMKIRMKAEARFFRALSYWQMMVKFGRVPLITEVLPYDAPPQPRADLDKVKNYVLTELEEIAEILPSKYSGGKMNETGRITRAAALALHARVALFYKDYAKAEKSATAIINEGHHSLFQLTSLNTLQQKEADEMDDFIDYAAKGLDKEKFTLGMFSYQGLWQGENAKVSNPEYILTREYMHDKDFVDWARYQYVRPSQLVKGYSSYEPMQDLVDAYWDVDGKTLRAKIDHNKRKSDFEVLNAEVDGMDQKQYIDKVPSLNVANYAYMQEFRNRDSRLYASVMIPFMGWHTTDFGSPFYYRWNPKNTGNDGNESWTGYSWRKMVATHGYDAGGENHAYEDFPLIRFAEVLLVAAEAHIQNVGYDATAQKHLNLIRERCGMPNVPTSMPSKEAALDFVRNERRIELAGEGQRYADMRRYGSDYCNKVMSGTSYAPNGYIVVEKNWNDYLMLMPIPQEAIDLNPLLKDDQNPGY